MRKMLILSRPGSMVGLATARLPMSLVVALAMSASLATAAEHAPRVLSPHNADAYSMRTFAEFPRWRDLNGDAKVYEIYKYLADRRTGIFPMGAGAWEGRDPVYEFGYIRDPVKMINVYSVGYCDMLGPTMAGIMQDMGIGPARTLNLPGWGHVVAEVFYDGKWHYLDLDVRAVFRRPDGSLASLAEAQRDDSLWTRRQQRRSSSRWTTWRTPAGSTPRRRCRSATASTWAATRWTTCSARARRSPAGGSRKGTAGTIMRRTTSGRFPATCWSRSRGGPSASTPSFTIHTRGNGRFVYAPDLTERSSDFADGVYDAQGVRPGPAGLTGQGYAIFEVRSPYVIVPRVGDFDTTEDDAEASVVRLDASGVTPSVSVDNGLTWTVPGLARPDAARRRAVRLPAQARFRRGRRRAAQAGDHDLGAGSSGVAARPAQGDERDALCDRRPPRPGHASRRDPHQRQRPGGFLQVSRRSRRRISTRRARPAGPAASSRPR